MNEKKIPLLITGGMPEYLMEKILTDGYEMKHIENPSDEELAAAEVIVGFPPVPRLSSAANLKWLQIPWSGADGYADHPDFPAHVTLTNATGAFGRPIAEYAFAAVFSLMRRFHQYRDVQKESKWERQGDEMTPTGKKVLILGAGDIGTNAARLYIIFCLSRVPLWTPASCIIHRAIVHNNIYSIWEILICLKISALVIKNIFLIHFQIGHRRNCCIQHSKILSRPRFNTVCTRRCLGLKQTHGLLFKT